MKKLFPILYLVILFAHIFAGLSDNVFLANITKPFILVSLILFFLFSVKRAPNNTFFKFMLLGLVFSLFGDVLLIFQNESSGYFIAGLSTFLLAHVMYIFAFIKTYRQDHHVHLIKQHGWLMVVVFAYAYFFFKGLQDHLHDMIGPVLVYTIAISLMLIVAINRYARVSAGSFWLIVIGATFFVASDSILAWNKFVETLPFSQLSIMLTYGLAQLGIAYGAIFQLQEQTELEKT